MLILAIDSNELSTSEMSYKITIRLRKVTVFKLFNIKVDYYVALYLVVCGRGLIVSLQH